MPPPGIGRFLLRVSHSAARTLDTENRDQPAHVPVCGRLKRAHLSNRSALSADPKLRFMPKSVEIGRNLISFGTILT